MPDSEPTPNTALVAIDFHGDQLVTCMNDGEPHVAMRRVVENIGLNWAGQHSKIVDRAAQFNCMDIHTVGADGRSRTMLVMPVSKLPLWLATINPNKIPDPVKRAKVELYQAESAIVLHDYWTKGVVVRGDMDGIVTSLDPKVMSAIGGMVKGIVGKAISELVPSLVEARLLQTRAVVAPGMTAGEVVVEAGIHDRKGLRGLPRRVSDRLRRYCAEKQVPVQIGRLGSTSAYVFDPALVREWLLAEGRQFIHRIVDDARTGQGKLKLVKQ